MSILLASSCASTNNSSESGEIADPFEPVNRSIYAFNDTVDKHIAEPIAKTYRHTPSPIRTGVTNFFNNADDVISILNDILQFKPEQTVEDCSRVVFNTTFGILGIFDIASDWDLPRHNERFADTLGYWGISSGPYLVLPIWGPSSLRDGPALIVDIYSYPLVDLYPIRLRNSLQVLRMVNKRTNLLELTDLTKDIAIDPYSFTRDVYYQWRQNQIYDGNPPEQIPQDFNPEELE